MALELKAACGSIVRPDIAPRTITFRAGVHTGIKIYFEQGKLNFTYNIKMYDMTEIEKKE